MGGGLPFIKSLAKETCYVKNYSSNRRNQPFSKLINHIKAEKNARARGN